MAGLESNEKTCIRNGLGESFSASAALGGRLQGGAKGNRPTLFLVRIGRIMQRYAICGVEKF